MRGKADAKLDMKIKAAEKRSPPKRLFCLENKVPRLKDFLNTHYPHLISVNLFLLSRKSEHFVKYRNIYRNLSIFTLY